MAIVGASSPSFVDKMLVAVGLILYEGRYYYGRHGRLVVVLFSLALSCGR